MNVLARRGGLFVLVLGWLSVCTSNAVPVVANGSLSFSNVKVTPSVGSLSFFGPWTAEAFADADGFGAFDSSFDGVTPALASSSSLYATGSALASPLTLTGSALASVSLPDGVDASSFATGRSSLYNFFMISGGTGLVDVMFSADVSASLSVATSGLGVSANTETTFDLELDGSPVLFRTDALSIGANSAQSLSFATTLSASRTLQFDTPYFVFIQADSDMKPNVAKTPESTAFLIDCGLVVVALRLMQQVVVRRKLIRGTKI